MNSISQDEYESAKEELEVAKASVTEYNELIAQASISVKTAETNLSYTSITSPIDGVVISIPVSEGQTVNSNQSAPTIVQVADLSKMLIKAEVAEGDITKVKSGMEVEVETVANPDKTYKSTVQSVDYATSTLTDNEYSESVSNTSAVYYYANIVLDNEDGNFGEGENRVHILKNISLTIEKGDFVSIIGQSGSGKSTLMNIMVTWIKLLLENTILLEKKLVTLLLMNYQNLEKENLVLSSKDTICFLH